MKNSYAVTLLLGVLALTMLVAWQGVDSILTTLATVGVRSLWLPVYAAIPLTFAVCAWQTLFLKTRLAFSQSVLPAITGLSINWLLPSAQIGGELARWQMGVQRGQDSAEAGAAAVVDKTMQLLTQIVFTLVGLVLLLWRFSAETMGVAIGLTTALFAGLVGVAFWIQRRGMFDLLLRAGTRFKNLPSEWKDSSVELDAAVREMYGRRVAIWRCAIYRLIFRFLMVGEIWLAFYFLGAEVGLVEAIILESAAQAIRVGAFFIPAGVGAQEGGLVALGMVMGLSPELCLSAGLCKRVRELMIGLPAIWIWQAGQARRLVGAEPAQD